MRVDRRKRGKPSIAPAEGERKLRLGIGAQDDQAAMLTLRGLRDGSLEWIRVADPKAGKLDDFQIASTGRVDAYQVKYSDSSSGLGFRWFTGMLPGIIDSWEELSAENPDRQVVAHLFATQRASTRDAVKPLGDPPPSPRHFAAFIEHVLRPTASAELLECGAIPEPWRPAWSSLAGAVDMDDEELFEFARHLRVEMGQTIPDGQPVDPRLDPTLTSDLEAIANLIDRSVRKQKVTLSRRHVLESLNWLHRTELRSHHDFPIDPLRYRRNERSSAALTALLRRLTGGYVALIGPPGSGKSSLLTDVLRDHPGVVARYYVHVPGEVEVKPTRARAVSFLHDLTLAIERAGMVRGETFNSGDPDVLSVRLERQLEGLNELARSRGTPSVILIDGLDHVERALPRGASESLLRYLPANVPNGVLIVLGSQTLSPAPEHVRTELARDGRTIKIVPIERSTVMEIARAAGVRDDDERREQIYARSAGHPLHVLYLSEQLAAADADGRDWEPEDVPGGKIEELYRRCWSTVEHDARLVELFALIARWQGPIDLELFAERGYRTAVIELIQLAGHFFRKEAHDRWLFFHSSFRDFLIAETDRAGGRADRDYHRELAAICATLPGDHPASWAQLTHLLMADDDERVSKLATPELFREQVGALRAPHLVVRDIRAALDASVRRRDLVAVAKLVIAQDEVYRHRFGLSDTHRGPRLPVLLIRLGRLRQALAYLGNDTELHDNAGVACEASVALDIAGERVEAERLFALAELQALRGVDFEDNLRADEGKDVFEEDREHLGYDRRSLMAWAAAAPRFRPPADVVEQVLSVTRCAPRSPDRQDKTMLRSDLLLAAGRSLVELGDLAGAARVSGAFDKRIKYARSLRLMLDVEACRCPDIKVEASRLRKLLRGTDPARYNDGARVLAAESLLLAGRPDTARAWVDSLPQPTYAGRRFFDRRGEDRRWLTLRLGREDRACGDEDLMSDESLYDFKLNRVLAAIRRRRAGAQHDGDSRVAAVARALGRIDAGRAVSARELGELVERLAPSVADANRGADGERGVLVGVLVWIACRVGPDARACVLAKLGDGSGLPATQRWRLLSTMASHGVERQWVRARLQELDAAAKPSSDVDVELALAEAWLDLGELAPALDRARRGVRAALAASHDDEWSLPTWAQLIQPLLNPETPEGGEWARQLGRCLVAILDANLHLRHSYIVMRDWMGIIGATHPVELVRVGRWLERSRHNGYWDTWMILQSLAPTDAGSDLAWHVLQDVLVPMAPYGGSPALDTLVRATPSEQLAPRLQELTARIAVEAVPSSREFWAEQLAELAKPTRRAASSTLGRTISSGAQLIKRLGRRPRATGQEEWVGVVARIADTLTVAEVRTLFLLFASTFNGPRIGVILRERLRQLGEDSIVTELAHEAYDTPHHQQDAELRLASIAAFAPSVARDIFWKQLESDPARGMLPVAAPFDVSAETAGRALDVLAASAEERQEMARALAGFVASLLRASIPSPDPDPPLDCARSARAALAALLANPVHDDEALDGARARASARLLAQGDRDIAQQLMVDGSERRRLRNLRIVDAALRGGDPPPDVCEHVSKLAYGDPSPLLRTAAREVAMRRLSVEIAGTPDAAILAEARAALDPVCLVHQPIARPSEIGPMEVREEDDFDVDAWLDACDGASEPPGRVGQLRVLGEMTTLWYPLRRPPLIERRTRALARAGAECSTNAVESVVGLSSESYADHRAGRKAPARLLLERRELAGGPRCRWLALHPAVARQCGWTLCDGLFAWCDASGTAMVHSLWWKDGTPIAEMGPEDEIGEGWLVLATDEAMRQLHALDRALQSRTSVVRSTVGLDRRGLPQ